MTPVRRRWRDSVISGAVLLGLVAALALFDGRVRERVSDALYLSSSPSAIAAAPAHLRSVTSDIAAVARDRSIEQAPMVAFVAAAVVLVAWMLRS